MLERLKIPLLDQHARHVVDSILAKRIELASLHDLLSDIFDGDALTELAGFYRQSRGDLRRLLAAAHEATEHAAADGASRITQAHVRFGIAQWQ